MGPTAFQVAMMTFLKRVSYRELNCSDEGFTLLELLVVLTIISLTVLSASTLYSLIFPNFQARQFANDLANVARDLRRNAVRQQKVLTLLYSEETKTVVSLNKELFVPVELQVDFSQEMEWNSMADKRVEFYPSGGTSGGSFEIHRGNVKVTVNIDWVTGTIEVEQ